MKERMRLDAERDVEIARRPAHGSSVALSRYSQPRALLRPRWNPNLHCFGRGDAPVARAVRAAVAQLAGSLASRAGEIEAHRPRRLAHVAAAVALRAHYVGPSLRARAVAHRATFLARYVYADLRALDRLPEVDAEAVFEIGSGLPRRCALLRARPPEPLIENVLEVPCACAGGAARRSGSGASREYVGKIEASEIHVGRARARSRHATLRIEAHLIVHLLLLRIAQNVVGFLDLLESLLRRLIPGI